MQRILLAIGCNNYDEVGNLGGAENDAVGVFEALCDPNVGNFDKTRSKLLRSPTLAQTRDALTEVLFGGGPIDTFTFYFAGHGEAAAASFYMILRDTNPEKLSVSGLSFTQLLLMISEAAPLQTNIIVDACFSGGVVKDMGAIIKPELIGDAQTSSLVVLAMAAQDQPAEEDDAGGVGTTALLDYVTGRLEVPSSLPFLDLIEIGKSVSTRLKREVDQTPALWVLNSQQASILCKNPRHERETSAALERFNTRDFLRASAPLLAAASKTPALVLEAVDRLLQGLVDRAETHRDASLPLLANGTKIAALLPYTEDRRVSDYVCEAGIKIATDAVCMLDKLLYAASKDSYALLRGTGSGAGGFFYLPVRITNVLGWGGYAIHAEKLAKLDLGASGLLAKVAELIVNQYSTAVRLMSDRQAAATLIGLTALSRVNQELGEAILSLLLADCAAAGGLIADSHLSPEDVLPYLLRRQASELSRHPEMVAQPSEALTVVIRSSPLVGLETTVDEVMNAFDHRTINAFIPETYRSFAEERIEGGENVSFFIGHDVWTVADIEAAWPSQSFLPGSDLAVSLSAVVCSLLFPDRVPWFLLPKREPSSLPPGGHPSASSK